MRFWFLLLLVSTASIASEVNLTELNRTLTTLSERLNQQQVQITPAQFRWQEWERFEQELNFVVAHDPVTEAGSVPEELQSDTLNQRLYARWDDLATSAAQMNLTKDNAVWSELEESMKKFFQYREKQVYRMARAQMKSGEIREALMELYEQAAERGTKALNAPQVRVQVLDPAVMEASKSLQQIARGLQSPKTTAKNEFTVTATTVVSVAGFFLLVSALALWGWLRKLPVKTVTVTKEVPLSVQVGSTEEWMQQLEVTLSRQQNLEVQQEEELRQARQLLLQLKQAIHEFKNAQKPQDMYLNLEKIDIATQAIDSFVEKQDPLRFAEVPYLLTKLILSMSDSVERRPGKADMEHVFS